MMHNDITSNTSDKFINFTQSNHPPLPNTQTSSAEPNAPKTPHNDFSSEFSKLNINHVEPTLEENGNALVTHHSKSSSNNTSSVLDGVSLQGSVEGRFNNSANQNPPKNENSNQFENIPDNQTIQKTPEINITASGIPISNTLNSSGSISYLPGTASLVEEVDKKQLVMLRDGRMLIGVLRSVDQFANLVLQNTQERVLVNNEFCDIQRGIYLIRGENVALMGDIDQVEEDKLQSERPDQKNPYLTKMNKEYITKKYDEKERKEQEERKDKSRMLRERGLIMYKDFLGDQYVN